MSHRSIKAMAARIAVTLCAVLPIACSLTTPGGIVPPARMAKPEPKPLNIRAGTYTFKASDGTPIVYEVRGSAEPTLVFIHCWACDRSYWRHQLATFSTSHRVIAVDLAGHGESGTARERWSLDGLAQDVAELVTSLDLPDVVLVGHSMGGPVALLASAQLPGRVRGVACLDTLHNAETRITPEMIAPLLAGYEQDFPGTMTRMVESMFPPGADRAVAQEVIDKSTRTPREPALALLRAFADFDAKRALERAGVPVRCINAAPRPPFTPETAVEVNRRHGDFDAVLMHDIGHYLMLERPQELDENLRWVLKDFPAPADR